MNTIVSLNGNEWLLKSFYGEDWLLRSAHLPDTQDRRAWLPAEVPGSVQNDIWRAGEIPNPYFERNSLQAEWTAARSWVYKRSFQADPAWKNGGAGARARLRFSGIDYDARFFLNGEALGEHHSMYTPVTFEIGDRLRWGEDNLLSVAIDTARIEWPQIGYTSRVRTMKARMGYWWDFSPRFVHQGIWDGVDLLISGPAAIEDVWVRPVLEPGYQSARVTTTVEVSLPRSTQVEVTCALRLGDQPVAHQTSVQTLGEGISRVVLEATLDQPALWWPNGFGPQNLYTADVTVRVLDGSTPAESDRRSVSFGIREVLMVPNEGAPAGARPYTLQVNGQRMWLRGWNWVPMDVLYGVERPARLQHLLGLARDANVNLLRVWGGGLIEREAFYNLCDRYGLLVWQEFIQSSSGIDNNAPEDPQFIGWVADQARQIVRGRRNHPSMAIWCGGNELMRPDGVPLDDDHPMLAVLKAIVEAQDPGRLWLPTSSSGPFFSNSLEQAHKDPDSLHDVHGPWEYQGLQAQYTLYNGTTSLFHSEFGAEGLTNRRTLNTVIAPEHQWPVSLDNPVWMHLAAWWVKEKLWRDVFGALNDIESVQRGTQFIQFEGVRYAIEANRRRSFRNSGSIPWQFNEPYPMASCTSAVDYYGVPKPMYYGVRRAYRPAAVSARYDTLAWTGKDTFEAGVWAVPAEGQALEGASLTWRLVSLDGQVAAEGSETVSGADDHPVEAAQARCPLAQIDSDLFFLDLKLTSAGGETLAENRYLFTQTETLAPLFALPPAQVESAVSRDGEDWTVTLTNTGPVAALYLQMELDPVNSGGWANLDDNYFSLLPGESRQVRVSWENAAEDTRHLALWGWNLPERLL